SNSPFACVPNAEGVDVLKARLAILLSLATILVALALACPKPAENNTTTANKPAEKVYKHDDKMKETLVDVFPGMDGPNLNLTPDEIRGRIVWNIWVGDSGDMWDYLAQHGFGTADLLKTIDSRVRPHRFAEIGLMNQPGFQTAAKAD